MKIYGTVTDAAKDKPLAKAKVELHIGQVELATFYSDKEGKFELEYDLDQYVGKDLRCRVEKDNFEPHEVTYEIANEDIPLDIKLVSSVSKPEPIPTPTPSPSPDNKRLKLFALIGAVIVAVLVVIIIYFKSCGQPFDVTEVSIKADPVIYTGKCPKTIRFVGNITANGKGVVKYRFIRSDGFEHKIQTLTFESEGSKPVGNTWRLYGNYKGWQAIHILSPQDMRSDRANFEVKCKRNVRRLERIRLKRSPR
ncbi:MAG TPA: hypothetical protein ENG51_18435 [Deltaproteobacteria bacterium]|nr:MAG: hypothetical protein DRG35_01335 [Deltaproteobacteria bacterium]HDM78415.1 hypothetical protein [Deltaproteobacteria bacterium]